MAHGPRLDPSRRRELSAAYSHGAQNYDALRPRYPQALISACLEGIPPRYGAAERDPLRVADVGAGSGIFSRQLMEAGAQVWAVDPSAQMLSVARSSGVRVKLGTGEETGLTSQYFDALTYAQSWHWVDPVEAGREAARLVRPKGRLCLVWNQFDVSIPWVHRLSRIMRSGDVFADPSSPPRPGGRWRSPEFMSFSHAQDLDLEALQALARTRSSYRGMEPEARRRMMSNIRKYMLDDLGHVEGERIVLPYVSFAWVFTRSSRVDPHERPL